MAGRPKTTSIDHQLCAIRIPKPMLGVIRDHARLGARSLNSEVLLLLGEALALRQEYVDVQDRMFTAGASRRRAAR